MTKTRTLDWRQGYSRGRLTGAKFRGAFGPEVVGRNRRDEVLEEFSHLMVRHARGEKIPKLEVAAMRRRALTKRFSDWDGMVLGIVATLATAFGNEGAKNWMPALLAAAGRFDEVVDIEPEFVVGGPKHKDWLIVVTALAGAGRGDLARAFAERLDKEFPPDADDNAHLTVWGEDDLSQEYARLQRQAPGGAALPVFFHLPFSGGTSMIVALKRLVPWGRMVQINRRHGLLQVEHALQMPAEDAERLMLVHQHHPFPLQIPGRELSHFTVLRDPVSQIRSGYFKRISTPGIVPTLDESPTFDDHIAYTVKHGMTNMLARQIVTTHPDLRVAYGKRFAGAGQFESIRHEEEMFWLEATAGLREDDLLRMCRETLDERFHLVGTMRHLEASHLAAAASTGALIADRVGHRGASGQPERTTEESAAVRRLREANGVDQLLYDEYTARFEQDHSALIELVGSH
ncbi:hypothetical protein ACIGB8_20840 [Promicromonospora sukumoe]|uniref:Sulfotransferase family protein n=1 Tax=Promicromonospora sukumoe TaxID=88382 RepID=A0A7W3PFU0_9MICO|nr:hypothetical protein [Promicromonospora sukumoe]MBA8809997.1 hypothetical protein [Promicromonospora sukumoe]